MDPPLQLNAEECHVEKGCTTPSRGLQAASEAKLLPGGNTGNGGIHRDVQRPQAAHVWTKSANLAPSSAKCRHNPEEEVVQSVRLYLAGYNSTTAFVKAWTWCVICQVCEMTAYYFYCIWCSDLGVQQLPRKPACTALISFVGRRTVNVPPQLALL